MNSFKEYKKANFGLQIYKKTIAYLSIHKSLWPTIEGFL